MLDMDTSILAILDELRIDILTTIVISEDLEFPPRLFFNQGSIDVIVTSECIHLYFLCIVTRCLLWDIFVM